MPLPRYNLHAVNRRGRKAPVVMVKRLRPTPTDGLNVARDVTPASTVFYICSHGKQMIRPKTLVQCDRRSTWVKAEVLGAHGDQRLMDLRWNLTADCPRWTGASIFQMCELLFEAPEGDATRRGSSCARNLPMRKRFA